MHLSVQKNYSFEHGRAEVFNSFQFTSCLFFYYFIFYIFNFFYLFQKRYVSLYREFKPTDNRLGPVNCCSWTSWSILQTPRGTQAEKYHCKRGKKHKFNNIGSSSWGLKFAALLVLVLQTWPLRRWNMRHHLDVHLPREENPFPPYWDANMGTGGH